MSSAPRLFAKATGECFRRRAPQHRQRLLYLLLQCAHAASPRCTRLNNGCASSDDVW